MSNSNHKEMGAAYKQLIKINFKQEFVFGDPVSSFVKYANDNHIIIMGNSSKSILKKFLFGSKSVETLKKTNSPILIVRNE